MKKIVGILAVVLLAIVGFYYYTNYTGQDYYTQITTDGDPKTTKDDQGNKVTMYEYNLVAINKDGVEKKVTFNGFSGRPLRKEAYLKLSYNKKKGVLSWEEVQKSTIPEKASAKLK
ncbi:YxeA family protein [Carnobacterium gallinarum]|uniref:YxeA family protein n=1 Tax=Carnobacterium gallinarum TaxID=2749 RepID=UPI0005550962|nr:YxeA family protein [Carnobacterium gallinarum]